MTSDAAPVEAVSSDAGRGGFLRAARVVSLLTLASRVLGLVRDVLLASLVATHVRDAFLFAWTLPNLFRRLFGEGALSAAFIPTYARLLESGDAAAARRLAGGIAAVLVLGLVIGIGGIEALVFLPLDAGALFPHDSPEKIARLRELVALLAPYSLLVCGVAFLAGMHNARRSFAIPALMPSLLNVVWIAVLVIVAMVGAGADAPGTVGDDGVRVLAWAILICGVVQLVWTWWGERAHLPLVPGWPRWHDPDLREVLGRFVPMTLGLGIYQLNLVVDRFIAESCIAGDGAISALYLGDRLMQLPQSMVGVAVATAAFPELASLAARGDREGLGRAAGRALGLCLALALPAAAGLIIAARPLVDLCFSGPAFGDELSARTAAVIGIVALAVVAASLVQVLVRIYYATGETRAPVRIGLVAVGVNLVLNLSLVWTLAERGLAIATIVSTACNGFLLYRHLGPTIAPAERRRLRGLALRALAATLVMSLATWLALQSLPEGGSLWLRAGRVVIPVLVGVAVYVAVAPLVGVREVGEWLAWRAKRARGAAK